MRKTHSVIAIAIAGAIACAGTPTDTLPTSGGGGQEGAGGGGASTPSSSGGATTRDAGDASATSEAGAHGDGGDSGGGPPAKGTSPTLGGCAVLPADSIWNAEVAGMPVSALSTQYIAAIGASTGVHADFGSGTNGIPFVLVPGGQPMVPIAFDMAADESDPGPYPIPPNAPVEDGGDLHVLVLETGSCTLYELYQARKAGAGWTAGSGAVWHLSKNEQRPDGWTSADAAGLPIVPGLVRADEVLDQKEIRHALRVTVNAAQSAYIHPATHSDGTAGHAAGSPPMGLRLRLKASVDESGFSLPVQVIVRAMKRYGLIVADTGGDWYVSGEPSDRWDDGVLQELERINGRDFEALDTGPVLPY